MLPSDGAEARQLGHDIELGICAHDPIASGLNRMGSMECVAGRQTGRGHQIAGALNVCPIGGRRMMVGVATGTTLEPLL